MSTTQSMSESRRAELLAAYERHARRFAHDAESRARRGYHDDAAPAADTAPPAAAPSELHPSDRQVEVLRLIADGLSNRSIAGRLCISEETVKSHVKQLAVRFGSRSRAQTVSLGYRYGLLSPEPRLVFPGEDRPDGGLSPAS